MKKFIAWKKNGYETKKSENEIKKEEANGKTDNEKIVETLRKINLSLLTREEVEENGEYKNKWRTNTDILLDIKYLLLENIELQEKILATLEKISKAFTE